MPKLIPGYTKDWYPVTEKDKGNGGCNCPVNPDNPSIPTISESEFNDLKRKINEMSDTLDDLSVTNLTNYINKIDDFLKMQNKINISYGTIIPKVQDKLYHIVQEDGKLAEITLQESGIYLVIGSVLVQDDAEAIQGDLTITSRIFATSDMERFYAHEHFYSNPRDNDTDLLCGGSNICCLVNHSQTNDITDTFVFRVNEVINNVGSLKAYDIRFCACPIKYFTNNS